MNYWFVHSYTTGDVTRQVIVFLLGLLAPMLGAAWASYIGGVGGLQAAGEKGVALFLMCMPGTLPEAVEATLMSRHIEDGRLRRSATIWCSVLLVVFIMLAAVGPVSGFIAAGSAPIFLRNVTMVQDYYNCSQGMAAALPAIPRMLALASWGRKAGLPDGLITGINPVDLEGWVFADDVQQWGGHDLSCEKVAFDTDLEPGTNLTGPKQAFSVVKRPAGWESSISGYTSRGAWSTERDGWDTFSYFGIVQRQYNGVQQIGLAIMTTTNATGRSNRPFEVITVGGRTRTYFIGCNATRRDAHAPAHNLSFIDAKAGATAMYELMYTVAGASVYYEGMNETAYRNTASGAGVAQFGTLDEVYWLWKGWLSVLGEVTTRAKPGARIMRQQPAIGVNPVLVVVWVCCMMLAACMGLWGLAKSSRAQQLGRLPLTRIQLAIQCAKEAGGGASSKCHAKAWESVGELRKRFGYMHDFSGTRYPWHYGVERDGYLLGARVVGAAYAGMGPNTNSRLGAPSSGLSGTTGPQLAAQQRNVVSVYVGNDLVMRCNRGKVLNAIKEEGRAAMRSVGKSAVLNVKEGSPGLVTVTGMKIGEAVLIVAALFGCKIVIGNHHTQATRPCVGPGPTQVHVEHPSPKKALQAGGKKLTGKELLPLPDASGEARRYVEATLNRQCSAGSGEQEQAAQRACEEVLTRTDGQALAEKALEALIDVLPDLAMAMGSLDMSDSQTLEQIVQGRCVSAGEHLRRLPTAALLDEEDVYDDLTLVWWMYCACAGFMIEADEGGSVPRPGSRLGEPA